MALFNRLLVIINQNSRFGQADIRSYLQSLENDGVRIHFHRINKPKEIQSLIEGNAHRIDAVILGGGDGTINSALEVLIKHRLPLGIIPLGNANDLARTLGIEEDITTAVSIIQSATLRQIDLGSVNQKYFMNTAHIGLGVLMARDLSPSQKRIWGLLSYPKNLYHAFRQNRSFRARVSINGRKITGRFIQISVSNGKYFGGGKIIREDAAIDDGWLDVVLVKPQSFAKMLTLVPKLFMGFSEISNEKIIVMRSHKVSVRTRKPRTIVTDGEITRKTPARFDINPKILQVFAPAKI